MTRRTLCYARSCGALALAMGLTSFPVAGLPATADIPFTGAILSICALTVGVPGILAPNATYDELSSSNSGGSNGTIAALTTGGGFTITTEAPSNFTLSPTGGGTNVTFDTAYTATGVTTISLSAGETISPLNVGLTTVSVRLEATKSTGSFPAGAYSAEVLVRCE
jgi:hypothetical protein